MQCEVCRQKALLLLGELALSAYAAGRIEAPPQ